MFFFILKQTTTSMIHFILLPNYVASFGFERRKQRNHTVYSWWRFCVIVDKPWRVL